MDLWSFDPMGTFAFCPVSAAARKFGAPRSFWKFFLLPKCLALAEAISVQFRAVMCKFEPLRCGWREVWALSNITDDGQLGWIWRGPSLTPQFKPPASYTEPAGAAKMRRPPRRSLLKISGIPKDDAGKRHESSETSPSSSDQVCLDIYLYPFISI